MTIQDRKTRRGLSFCTVKRIRQPPNPADAISPFAEFLRGVFDYSKGGICNDSME